MKILIANYRTPSRNKTITSHWRTYQKYRDEMSELITDLEKAFSIKNKSSVDTAIRKLTRALGSNNEFRENLLDKLEDLSGREITQQIAGSELVAAIRPGAVSSDALLC